MIVDERDNNQIKIYFASSPLDECLCSLHAMSNPDHHTECRDWLIKQHSRLSPALREELDFFGREYANWFFIADIANYVSTHALADNTRFEDQLERMLELDDVTFSYLFLGFPAFDYSVDIVRRWLADPSLVNEAELGMQKDFFAIESIRSFLSDVKSYKERLRWALSQYWEQCFSVCWERIEKLFAETVKREKLVFQKRGALHYINMLHPLLVADRERVVFRKTPEYSVEFQKIRTLVISFSVFSAPHLMGNVVGDVLSITKNVSFHALQLNEATPEELLKVFFAASDATRLKIMKMLWNSDSTTKEMAEVLSLSPSTVSLHLKILKDYDLVESSKIKKYVYYRLRREPFETLQDTLTQYFEY